MKPVSSSDQLQYMLMHFLAFLYTFYACLR